jgi:hypothetical protein
MEQLGSTVRGILVKFVILRIFRKSFIPLISDKSKAGDTLSSRHVNSRDITSVVGTFNIEFWRRLTLPSTLLTSRDLTWSSGRLTCQHTSQISVVAHFSWDMTYVTSYSFGHWRFSKLCCWRLESCAMLRRFVRVNSPRCCLRSKTWGCYI